MKKVMLSGIQPTGSIHIGNYLGAIKNWVSMLENYYGYFFIVDYHAITTSYDVALMQQRILEAATEYLACGLDTNRCTLFVQSHVRAHTELAWILNSITPVGELERMTQYKDKSRQHLENINTALLAYPVLQAADVLLYRPTCVPVGEDQTQHLELIRMIVRKFNSRFGEYFEEPKTVYSEVSKILGLDGVSKMSKSKGNHIPLRLSADETEKLILQKAVTDPDRKKKSDKGNPDVCNVYSWHKIFSSVEQQCSCFEGCRSASIGCVDCKKILIKNINRELAPIRENIARLDKEPDFVRDVLIFGAREASEVAEQTLFEVKDKMGLIDKSNSVTLY